MSKSMKIILPVVAVLFFAVVVTWSLNKDIPSETQTINLPAGKPTPVVSEDKEDNLPLPTGNVDDTVNAILSEASDEENLVSEESATAKSAADNSEETSDLSQTYDETEF